MTSARKTFAPSPRAGDFYFFFAISTSRNGSTTWFFDAFFDQYTQSQMQGLTTFPTHAHVYMALSSRSGARQQICPRALYHITCLSYILSWCFSVNSKFLPGVEALMTLDTLHFFCRRILFWFISIEIASNAKLYVHRLVHRLIECEKNAFLRTRFNGPSVNRRHGSTAAAHAS